MSNLVSQIESQVIVNGTICTIKWKKVRGTNGESLRLVVGIFEVAQVFYNSLSQSKTNKQMGSQSIPLGIKPELFETEEEAKKFCEDMILTKFLSLMSFKKQEEIKPE